MADEASIAATKKIRAWHILPLNSRRLTAVFVKRIAKALVLPDSAALDDLLQMVDGKLSEQVALIDTGRGVVIELWNEDGVFLRLWCRIRMPTRRERNRTQRRRHDRLMAATQGLARIPD